MIEYCFELYPPHDKSTVSFDKAMLISLVDALRSCKHRRSIGCLKSHLTDVLSANLLLAFRPKPHLQHIVADTMEVLTFAVKV